jgi:hypothetical protein
MPIKREYANLLLLLRGIRKEMNRYLVIYLLCTAVYMRLIFATDLIYVLTMYLFAGA